MPRRPQTRTFLLALALAAFAILTLLPTGAASAGATPSPIAACAFGTDVPGLKGFLAPAVDKAALSYGASLQGVTSQTRTQADRTFAAAAAAYVYGLAQVSVRSTVKRFLRNEIVSINALADPGVKTVVSPNVDTAYTVAWLDLATAPVVVNVPDTAGRYYTFQFLDGFSNAFAYVGSGSTGTHAGAYALVPPGWTGSLPAGVHRISAPSNTVWLLGRTLVSGPADLPEVKKLQSQYTVTPLAAWQAGVRQPPVVLGQYPTTTAKATPAGAQFIATLNQDMVIDPPPAADDCALRAMTAAGIQVPHPTPQQSLLADLSNQAPPPPQVAADPVVAAALSAGTAAADRIIVRAESRLNASSRRAHNGWEVLGNWVGRFGTRYLGRAIVARDLLGANTPQQAIYPIADTDVTGHTLNGSHRYTIRFAKGRLPPVNAFWSVTMYDASDYLYANPLGRYAIGDRTPGLHYGRDGSLTLYLEHAQPAAATQRANWLPAPSGAFHVILRLYEPKRSALTGRWNPAAINRVGARLAPRRYLLRLSPGGRSRSPASYPPEGRAAPQVPFRIN